MGAARGGLYLSVRCFTYRILNSSEVSCCHASSSPRSSRLCHSTVYLSAQAGAPPSAGQTDDPFPQPILSTEGIITVTFREFASLPDMVVAPRAR